jgi:hypothetical protein
MWQFSEGRRGLAVTDASAELDPRHRRKRLVLQPQTGDVLIHPTLVAAVVTESDAGRP